MTRRFADARELLDDLLDRHEAGAERPIARPDHAAFPSVLAADAFARELADAEQSGAISIARGRGVRREEISHVRLTAPDALYRHLRRTPAARLADEAHALLVNGLTLHPALADAACAVADQWRRARNWAGLGPEHADKVRGALVLAQAILDKRQVDLDYRTFSRRIAGDSKALERVEAVVVRLLSAIVDLPSEAKPREALRTLGIERFAPPLLIGGPIDLVGADLATALPLYLGLPPKEAERIRFRRPPSYLLTIENFASFNRHLIEADPDHAGATIYVGGYPSLATQQALGALAGAAPEDTPIFHWSDIDPDGAWIFRTVERAIGRPLRPHLMSPDIAERFRKVPAGKLTVTPCTSESGIAELVAYFTREDAKVLEQEELDPRIPQ